MSESPIAESIVPKELLARHEAALDALQQVAPVGDQGDKAAYWAAMADAEGDLVAIYRELGRVFAGQDVLIAIAMGNSARAYRWESQQSRKLAETIRGPR